MSKKLLYIFLFICVFGGTASSQPGLEAYKLMADDLYQENKYAASIDVYERILFFDTSHLSKSIYLPLARAYRAISNHEKASDYYDFAYISAFSDSLKNEIVFESFMNYFVSGDTQLAYNELLNFQENNITEKERNRYHLLMGTLDYKSGRYTSSLQHLLSISHLSDASKIQIQGMIKKVSKINRRYNPVKVQWMSIIPGLGQTWCGYYKEGVNALVLNGALVVLFVHVSVEYALVDGAMAVYPWFNRYYKGGIQKSYKLALRKRDVEQNKLFNSILRTLPPIN